MEIKLNGEDFTAAGDTATISELLKAGNVEAPELVTVQLNGNFVERGAFDTTVVRSGDEVDFLYYLGGGQAAA